MDIQILEKESKLQVLIKCKQADEQINRLKAHIELFDNKIQGKTEGGFQFVNAMEVLYFESVDDRVFLYTEESVMEVKQRLYELEEILSEKDLIQFFVWWRNGSAFCVSWFLILWVLYNSCYGISTISTEKLIEMIGLSVVGVFLFCTFFTRLFLRNWHFLSRLTCFVLSISILECIAFYWLGIFVRTGTCQEWLTFVGIILGLYVVCILIYQVYSKRKGELYTQALEQYQQKRSMENGK